MTEGHIAITGYALLRLRHRKSWGNRAHMERDASLLDPIHRSRNRIVPKRGKHKAHKIKRQRGRLRVAGLRCDWSTYVYFSLERSRKYRFTVSVKDVKLN